MARPASARYPASRHAPPPAVDLSDAGARARLSAPALRAFFNIMPRWRVRDEDARLLLGGVTNGPYYEMKRDPDRRLDVDRLTRVSLLIGIYKALHILHGEALADRWVHLPNTNRLFGGAAPLDFMRRGGIPAMLAVRRLLDARRAG
jgi:hypothetical protein